MLTRYVRGATIWVDLVSPTPQEVRDLMREFSLDPLIAEELLTPSFKPKAERRGDALYVILHFPALRAAGRRSEAEVDFVIGKHFLITARYEAFEPIHAFAKAFEVETVTSHNASHAHGGHFFVSLVKTLYSVLADDCAIIRHQLQEVEERIFNGDERRMVVELSYIGRTIHDSRQALAPHHDMLSSIEPAAARLFGDAFSYHMRSLEGSYQHVTSLLEQLREALYEMRETNNSLLTTKQNEIMKTLTVVSFFFLPLSFIASWFGMNTMHTPVIGNQYDFWILSSGMLTVLVACFAYFKYKRFL